ncbi:MAG TPA: hypothetical protein VFP84_05295 [Kofleriaceae bacterium]|nr:hypothetical protein [Kofleriaceae bacterium]
MLRFAAIVLGLAPMFAACGGGPSIAYSDFDQARQQARCERAARCGLFPDKASCLATARVVPSTSLAAAIKDDKVHYDGQRARQCVDAIAKQSCDLTAADSHIPPAACAEMFSGALKGGAQCSIAEECASGVCQLPNECPPTGCCVGTCRAAQDPAKAGGACARNLDCQDGLVCGRDQLCHVPAGEGKPCHSDPECATGLGCIGATEHGAGACRALPHAGQPCPYARCADENQRCDATSHTCVAVGKPGDPCPHGDECARGTECNAATGRCELYPQLGQPCDVACGGNAWCQFNQQTKQGTCVAPLPDGQACDGYNECESFYCEQGPVFDVCKAAYVCY